MLSISRENDQGLCNLTSPSVSSSQNVPFLKLSKQPRLFRLQYSLAIKRKDTFKIHDERVGYRQGSQEQPKERITNVNHVHACSLCRDITNRKDMLRLGC
jgi:hypothetical protein